MFENHESIKIENIFVGTSNKSASILSRKCSSIVLRTEGVVRYTFPEFSFVARPGDIYILPKGAQYSYVSLTDTPCRYVSIWFTGDNCMPYPSVRSIDGFPDASELKDHLADMWNFGELAEHYRCYSIIYNLLAYMKNIEKLTYADKKHYAVIAPAISYLKNHIYDSNLTIETLIDLCGISGTYFHKIFQRIYSTSPQKYIQSKRLSQAKSIIDNGDFNSVSEIAALVGYDDPLYFSRAFRKKYGVSPLHYAKQLSV